MGGRVADEMKGRFVDNPNRNRLRPFGQTGLEVQQLAVYLAGNRVVFHYTGSGEAGPYRSRTNRSSNHLFS